MNSDKDTLFAQSISQVPDFVFDEQVARVFPDMINRSIPGYQEIISSIRLITEKYIQEHSNLYDLGCSHGAAMLAMRQGAKNTKCQIIGIDQSSSMLKHCQQCMDMDNHCAPIMLKQGDICLEPISNASIVTLNFTLQFISQNERLPLLHKIANGMNTDGVLILSEKLVFDELEQNILEPLQLDFKRTQGYSELEISQKREAIANVLIPESLSTHKKRLKEAGFQKVILWFQYFNFASMIAMK